MGNNMDISMSLENIILDYDYTVIDILNRNKESKISYGQFDEEGIYNVWRSSFVESRERLYRKEINKKVLSEMEDIPMTVSIINKLIREGYNIHVFSNYYNEQEVLDKLEEVGVSGNRVFVYGGSLGMDRLIKLKEIEVRFYIEDNPAMIKLISKEGVVVVVKDRSYNSNFKNRMRLDCLSEIPRIIERTEEGSNRNGY